MTQNIPRQIGTASGRISRLAGCLPLMRALMLITLSLLLLGAVAAPVDAAPPGGACVITYEDVAYDVGPLDGHLAVPNGIECYY